MTNPGASAISRIDVDAIVREVLAQLAATPGGSEPSDDRGQSNGRKPSNGADAATGETANQVTLTGKVVSVAMLDGKLERANRLVVATGAVITPAARDLLRQKNITIHYASSNHRPEARHRLVVGLAESSYEPAALMRTVGPWVDAIEQLPRTGLVTVVEEMCGQVSRSGELGLLMTGSVAVAVCVANRQRGVRAAAAGSRQEAAGAVGSIGANLLVVDPAARSFFELQQIVKEFVLCGPRSCPAELSKHLT